MRRCRNLAVAILVLTSILIGGPAHSQPASETDASLRQLAQNHTEEGMAAYNSADWGLAHTEFEAAYRVVLQFKVRDQDIENDLLNNLSRVNERLGDYAMAIQQARRFLDGSRQLDQRLRDEQEGRIKRMQEALEGRPVPGPPPQVVVRPSSEGRRFPPGWLALTGGGGALLLGSVGCGIGFSVTADALSGSLTQVQIDGLVSQGRLLEGLTIGLGVAGAAATVGGIVWLVRWGKNQDHAAVSR